MYQERKRVCPRAPRMLENRLFCFLSKCVSGRLFPFATSGIFVVVVTL